MVQVPDVPLAERMRPKKIAEVAGQAAAIGNLQHMLQSGMLPSIIFWGPPGVGKTTLAKVLAEESGRRFFALNAVSSGVKEVRETLEKAAKPHILDTGGKAIVFIDEIHRFNKGQQDSLLSAVERGDCTLIGATTENPSFEVNPALLSRCQVLVLEALSADELRSVYHQALEKDPWLKNFEVKVLEDEALLALSGGDARKLLNYLEWTVAAHQKEGKVSVSNTLVQETIKQRVPRYDKGGEMHYDIISAFIKSVRGGAVQAALYWMARMIHGGEDPVFIARRLLILASEDIGLANPTALAVASAGFDAVRQIGMPEARIILAQVCVYLSSSPKSNASYLAIDQALDFVRNHADAPVPLHLRNAPTKLMKELGYGEAYLYPHNYPQHVVAQSYDPEGLKLPDFFVPGDSQREQEIQRWLDWRKKIDDSGEEEA